MIKNKLILLAPDPGVPFTSEQIHWIEGRIGAPLPEAYRWMLKTYGQLFFDSTTYFDPAEDSPVEMGWFFDYDELVSALAAHEDVLPIGIIPIGDDGGGNLYCLGITGDDRNKVYFHDHCIGWHSDAEKLEERGEAVPANIRYQTVHLLADSFEAFIDGMVRKE